MSGSVSDLLFEVVWSGLMYCCWTECGGLELIGLVWSAEKLTVVWDELVCYDVILGYKIHGIRDFKDILRLQLALLRKKGSGCRGKKRTCNLKLKSAMFIWPWDGVRLVGCCNRRSRWFVCGQSLDSLLNSYLV